MWFSSAPAEETTPTKGAYRDESEPKYNPPTEFSGRPTWQETEDFNFE